MSLIACNECSHEVSIKAMDCPSCGFPVHTQKVFTFRQAAIAGFFGGILASIYVLRKNFFVLGNPDFAKKTVLIGLVTFLLYLMPSPFVSNSVYRWFSLAYIIVTIQVIRKFKIDKVDAIESKKYTIRSNWKVVGIVISALVVQCIILLGWVFFVDSFIRPGTMAAFFQ